MFKPSSVRPTVSGILVIGLLACATATSAAQQGAVNTNARGGGGYVPWQGGGFGGPVVYSINSPTGPQQQQPQIIDLGPALGNAAFADTEFQNRSAALQIKIQQARYQFRNSTEMTAARTELDDAQRACDDARETVLSKLRQDQQYNSLLAKRTEEEVALGGVGLESPMRFELAKVRLEYGVQITMLEAKALSDDSTFQDARTRLLTARRNLSAREREFASALSNQPEIVAAKQQLEAARANKAAADAFLLGQEIARNDQLNQIAQSNSGNIVINSWYPRAWGW